MRIRVLLFIILLSIPTFSHSAPKIVTDSNEIDFGTIYSGEIKEHTFTLHNKGNSPLSIIKIHSDCGCSAAKTTDNTIEPNKTTGLHIYFNSRNLKGKIIRHITLLCNDPQSPKQQFTIKANIIREIILTPPRLVLKTPKARDTTGYDFTLTNQSDIPISITSIRSTSQYIKIENPPEVLGAKKKYKLHITVETSNIQCNQRIGYIFLTAQGHTANILQIPIVIKILD